jgi:enoyl-CoA hydratase
MTGSVLVHREEHTATVTLRNDGKQNAITVSMWRELRAAFERLSQDRSLSLIVIQGAGGHFAAGADISEFPEFRFDPVRLREYHEAVIAPALQAIWQCDTPVVAVIQGSCIGGGLEIAACCDLRIACVGAVFGAPIAKLGFAMAPLELHAVARAFGLAATREMLLTAALWDAPRALARGLVTSVHNAIEIEVNIEAIRSAYRILSSESLRINKRNLRTLADANFQLPALNFDYDALANSAEHRAAIHAFLGKSATPTAP